MPEARGDLIKKRPEKPSLIEEHRKTIEKIRQREEPSLVVRRPEKPSLIVRKRPEGDLIMPKILKPPHKPLKP